MESLGAIVTVYNRFEYVRNMIICLMRQTKQIDELILADDGSKENILEYIKDLIPQCKFKIKHVYQEDLAFRLSRSRNNGVRVAESDFLIFLDQDVIFDDNFIEGVYNNREKKKMLMTRAIMTSKEEKNEIQTIFDTDFNYKKMYSIASKEKRDEIVKKSKKDQLYGYLYKLKLRSRGAKIAGLFFALYKEDFININGFDEKYIGWGEEDDDFCWRFYKYGGEVKPLKNLCYLLHMNHNDAAGKEKGPNWEYYQKRKKEFSKTNYKPEYGYDNPLGEDKYILKIAKECKND